MTTIAQLVLTPELSDALRRVAIRLDVSTPYLVRTLTAEGALSIDASSPMIRRCAAAAIRRRVGVIGDRASVAVELTQIADQLEKPL